MADDFKDDLIPLALEYYLGVIEKQEQEDSEEIIDDIMGGKKGGDDDSDGDKKKKKKGKKKDVELPTDKDGNPQECKQQ